MHAVAISAHEIPERPALHVTAGQQVHVSDRDTEWPEFVFVTAANGAGWVPARYLSASTGDAVVLTGYDTTELPTRIGDRVQVLVEDEQSGWLWCRAESGREGWVPITTVQRDPPAGPTAQ